MSLSAWFRGVMHKEPIVAFSCVISAIGRAQDLFNPSAVVRAEALGMRNVRNIDINFEHLKKRRLPQMLSSENYINVLQDSLCL